MVSEQPNSESSRYVFPKWSNCVPLLLVISFFSFIFLTIFVFWYWMSPKHLEVGYEPTQPIPYSHRLHAGDLGIDCRYCHVNVEKGPAATVPPTEICMNCHKVVKTDSPHIMKLRESYATGKPMEWVKVHQLPDYVYFDHSRHVTSGVSCISCHGRVDQMDVVRQAQPMSMSWCLDCHRHPEKQLRPKDKVTQLSWVPSESQLEMGNRLKQEYHINPSEDCSTCHR